MQGIQQEEEEIKHQEELREQEELRVKLELEKKEEKAKKQEEAYLQEQIRKQAELLLQEQNKEAAPVIEAPKKKSIIGKFFSFIGRIFIMCFNLVITLLEQLQWILFAVVLTIAVYVVCNHYNVDIAGTIQQFLINLGL